MSIASRQVTKKVDSIIEKAGTVDRRDCWAFDYDMPLCKYYKLKKKKVL